MQNNISTPHSTLCTNAVDALFKATTPIDLVNTLNYMLLAYLDQTDRSPVSDNHITGYHTALLQAFILTLSSRQNMLDPCCAFDDAVTQYHLDVTKQREEVKDV